MSVPASQTGTIMRQGNFTRTMISGTRRNGARKRKRWIGSGDSILLLSDSGSLSESYHPPLLAQRRGSFVRIFDVAGKRHDESGPAAREIRRRDIAAVCSRNFPAETQAKAAAFAGRSGAAKKSIENMRQLRRMDSFAAVGDADNRTSRIALQPHFDRSAGRCELQRVVEQIHDEAPQMAFIAVDENVLRRVDLKL